MAAIIYLLDNSFSKVTQEVFFENKIFFEHFEGKNAILFTKNRQVCFCKKTNSDVKPS